MRNGERKDKNEVKHKEEGVMGIRGGFIRLMARMQEQGNYDGLTYLAGIHQKVFDEIRIQGHSIKMAYNGKSGLISTYLPFSEADEKVEVICTIGQHSATGYVDLAKESTDVCYADKVPNCIVIAILAMLFDCEAVFDQSPPDKKVPHRFRIITDGDGTRYSEFVELLNKLPLVFSRLEPTAVCEKGSIPVGALF